MAEWQINFLTMLELLSSISLVLACHSSANLVPFYSSQNLFYQTEKSEISVTNLNSAEKFPPNIKLCSRTLVHYRCGRLIYSNKRSRLPRRN